MGRPVLFNTVGSMYQVLCWWIVVVKLISHSSSAAGLDIYTELADEAILKRIQHVLSEWRQKQLRIHLQEHEVLPQFTFHFPEEPNPNYHSSLFAVPPSDPRYYQDPPALDDLSINEGKIPEEEKLPALDVSRAQTEDEQLDNSIVKKDDELPEDFTSESAELQSTLNDEAGIQKIFLLKNDREKIVFYAVVAGCGAAALAGVLALFIGWYKLRSNSKAAADIEYPAYGVTGPNKEITPTGDRRLAQSAQMYHYQHQKQQIIAMESNRANNERRGSVSEGESDEENEEGDYTVYECPGLAATGELEVKNPLFLDDPTPAAVTGSHSAEGDAAPAPKDKK